MANKGLFGGTLGRRLFTAGSRRRIAVGRLWVYLLQRMNWRWRLALLLLLVPALVFFRLAEDIGMDVSPSARFRVARIIDGDTMELAGGDRLRLLYIDTPEKGEPYYDSATALLSRLAFGREVVLQFGHRRRDGYGRLLAAVICDSINVNEALLESGYASVYLFRDNISDDSQEGIVRRMLAAQERALEARLGIWSKERSPEPEYLTTRKSLRFHRPGCRSVAGKSRENLRVFAIREEALREGLSACRNCRP